MRILFLTHTFNSLAQRLYVELTRVGYEVSIELDINDSITAQAVELYQPDLIIAPFLKRVIPEAVWKNHVCLIVHPGIVGDRGPSALDWAILNGEKEWGVTVLQAEAEMDAGPVWAAETFVMREVKKSSLYRNEVTEAAVRAVKLALERFSVGNYQPERPGQDARGKLHQPMKQTDRAIDWSRDDTATVLRKIRSADGFPGVLDRMLDQDVYLFDAWIEPNRKGVPGEVIGHAHGALCRATVDGAVWIGHVKAKDKNGNGEACPFKLSATQVFAGQYGNVGSGRLQDNPILTPALPLQGRGLAHDIRYEEANGVGYLHFEFYNGAMSTDQCNRLQEAFVAASKRDIRVLVLMGGEDYWSNGIHLNAIENADSPADESWRNINAMNDLARAIITCDRQITLSALQGNAGAGGVFLSLAADEVHAREGVLLNPHYKSMGNLYGSEYWTYLLPKRVGVEKANELTRNRLPIGAPEALSLGMIDACCGVDRADFRRRIDAYASALAASSELDARLIEKKLRRHDDEMAKPLEKYREEEMQHMKLNFYGFDPSYHVARYHFVHKVPHAWTPLFLARHRQIQPVHGVR